MFVPAHNEKLLESAFRSDADVLLLDVEDSVQPTENKSVARANILRFIQDHNYGSKKIFARINDRESGQLIKDVMELAVPRIHGFMYPKSYTEQDIHFIDKLLTAIEYDRGYDLGYFKLIPLIETASAVLKAYEIASSSNRIVAIAFGSEDYISDMKGIHDIGHESLFTARGMIAMAARAARVIPIDTVHVNVHDLDDLEMNLSLAKNLGYEGALVLHPKEIPIVHRYFSPTEEEVQRAEEMLRLSEEAESQGRGVAIIDSRFIGPPMVIKAKDILKRNRLIEEKRML
jgi:citrate lyase subunit beta/citryl-CoA lyase